MKRLILFLAVLAIAAVPSPKPIRLLFDYPASDLTTNLVFVMHGTTNLLTPQPWPVEALLPAVNSYSNGVWNLPTNGLNVTFEVMQAVQPGAHFFYVTASNQFWEVESDPSNVLAFDPLPREAQKMRAIKGW